MVGGVRYAVPGDRAILEADGRLRLLGRDSVTINTGGEKVFAEEVEHALKHHPAVYDAVVVGTPHERFGSR
jgi:fatty-acyl-CoA synthase